MKEEITYLENVGGTAHGYASPQTYFVTFNPHLQKYYILFDIEGLKIHELNIPEELVKSVGLVQPRLPVCSKVQDVLESVVDVRPLLVNILDVKLLAGDQRVSLGKREQLRLIKAAKN